VKPSRRQSAGVRAIDVYMYNVCAQLKFPHHFSGELKDCVKNLLQVDITNRYGNMKNGTDDVKNCKFFAQTNWGAVLSQSVRRLRYTDTGYTVSQ